MDEFDRIFKIGGTGLLNNCYSMGLTPTSALISYAAMPVIVLTLARAGNGSRCDINSKIKY
jgi:hypothetical protein